MLFGKCTGECCADDVSDASFLSSVQQTLSLFFQDLLKSILLTIAIGVPVTAAIITIAQRAGPWLIPCLWAFSFLLSVFFLTIYPVAIAPLFNAFVPVSTVSEDVIANLGSQDVAQTSQLACLLYPCLLGAYWGSTIGLKVHVDPCNLGAV